MQRIGLELMTYSSITLLMMLVILIFGTNGVITIVVIALMTFVIGCKLTEKEDFENEK